MSASTRILSSASALSILFLMQCIIACPVSAAQKELQSPAETVTSPPEMTLHTIMCERGELIFQDDFDSTTPIGAWGGYSAGEWTSGNGLLRVTYTGGHSLYHEQVMPMKDVVMQVSFRFEEGVNVIGMGMEGGPSHHALRWNFHRNAIDLQRMPGVGTGNNLIDSLSTKLDAGRWYTMVMELCGTEMLVTIDESHLLYGTANGIDCDKHSIILSSDAAGGKYAWFAHCSVWRATSKRDWPAKREQVKGLIKKSKDATPEAVNQLMQEDACAIAPVFIRPSSIAKVTHIEEQIASGEVATGSKLLEKLAIDKDPALAHAAAASLEVVAAWKRSIPDRIAELTTAGDIYQAAEIASAMAKFLSNDAGGEFRERAALLKKDPGYNAGKEYQKLAAIPFYARQDARFFKLVETFEKKYPDGFYAVKARQFLIH